MSLFPKKAEYPFKINGLIALNQSDWAWAKWKLDSVERVGVNFFVYLVRNFLNMLVGGKNWSVEETKYLLKKKKRFSAKLQGTYKQQFRILQWEWIYSDLWKSVGLLMSGTCKYRKIKSFK